MPHAFLIEAGKEEGTKQALAYVKKELSLAYENNPDVTALSYEVLSVENAREVLRYASQTSLSGTRALIVSCERIYHEAQNALLKLFEEPPEDLTLYVVLPTRAQLLPTLLSRLTLLEERRGGAALSEEAETFLRATPAEREKLVARLIADTKSEREDTKQEARTKAISILEGVTVAVHQAWQKEQKSEHLELLRELSTLMPIARERSAPYKLIFEHLLIVLPKKLS